MICGKCGRSISRISHTRWTSLRSLIQKQKIKAEEDLVITQTVCLTCLEELEQKEAELKRSLVESLP